MEYSRQMPHLFPHHHLLDIERLSVADIDAVLDLAAHYAAQNRSANKKIGKLNGKTVVNLFFEPSTRTRSSFEIAAKRLGADVINIPVEHSSAKKGETLLDTVLNLDAMQIDALVIRHAENGVPQFIAPQMKASVINAGDGTHEHPTQALLDALTIRRHKKTLKGLTITYCGDFIRSRVANSFIELMSKYGNKIRVVAPPDFLTDKFKSIGAETTSDLKTGLHNADVVMTQRIQMERMGEGQFAMSLKEYHDRYGLSHDKLKAAKPDVIVMNPGPVIRDVEITSALADDPQYSVILEQTEMGVAVRMAVLDLLLSQKNG
jgi:aspartate carbamoyltransferase catalytic subunit